MDRPIIFSAAMVRALLNGSKTQTRRILPIQPKPFLVEGGKECEIGLEQLQDEPRPRIRLGRVITTQEVRYAPGDRLWVRETVRGKPDDAGYDGIEYLADGRRCKIPDAKTPDQDDRFLDLFYYRNQRAAPVPSIHMPRWASRLTLQVTGVKVERLNDISEADAMAEGARPIIDHGTGSQPYLHRIGFEHLWCSIHGETAWIDNPFVVAITFRVIKANIDAPEARAA